MHPSQSYDGGARKGSLASHRKLQTIRNGKRHQLAMPRSEEMLPTTKSIAKHGVDPRTSSRDRPLRSMFRMGACTWILFFPRDRRMISLWRILVVGFPGTVLSERKGTIVVAASSSSRTRGVHPFSVLLGWTWKETVALVT